MKKSQYTWNPLTDSVIEETDGTGNISVTYTNKPQPFGPLVSQNRGGTTSQFHFDAIGSTRLLTNETPAVTDSYSYDAWGNPTAHSGATFTPFKWIGQRGAQASVANYGHYSRARTYSSSLGMWTSIDPISRLPGVRTVKLYSYCNSNPVGEIDPSGFKSGKPIHSQDILVFGYMTFTGTPQSEDQAATLGPNMRFTITFKANGDLILINPSNDSPENKKCPCRAVDFIQIVSVQDARFGQIGTPINNPTGNQQFDDCIKKLNTGWAVDMAFSAACAPKSTPFYNDTAPYKYKGQQGTAEYDSGGLLSFTDAILNDEPGIQRQTTRFPAYRFETCAVCREDFVSGKGLVTKPRYLGCVKFGFWISAAFNDAPPAFDWPGSEPAFSDQPSQEFLNTVAAWNTLLYPQQ